MKTSSRCGKQTRTSNSLVNWLWNTLDVSSAVCSLFTHVWPPSLPRSQKVSAYTLQPDSPWRRTVDHSSSSIGRAAKQTNGIHELDFQLDGRNSWLSGTNSRTSWGRSTEVQAGENIYCLSSLTSLPRWRGLALPALARAPAPSGGRVGQYRCHAFPMAHLGERKGGDAGTDLLSIRIPIHYMTNKRVSETKPKSIHWN